jgi:hypothetical protein
MSSPTGPPRKSSLHLPLPRPTFQPEYTATPSHWRFCTPKSHHGFIARHTSTPEHTLDSYEDQSNPSNGDYFSVRKNNPVLSPDPAPYEAHGFLPLCSVAAVGAYANDYLSVSSNQNTAMIKASFQGFESPDPSTGNESDTASAPTSRFPGYINISHLSLHPTGSPIHERDVVTLPGQMEHFRNEDVPVMRGGGGDYFYEKERESSEDIHEEENQSQNAIFRTGNSPRNADKPVGPPKTEGDNERRVFGAATEPTKERAGESNTFPSLDPEIEALLARIAAAFPNASLKIPSSAHASEDDENNTSTRNSDRYSGATTNKPLPTDNSCQPELNQPAYPDTSLEENQIMAALPVVDLDTMVHDNSMDNPELGKILPLPLSPRPSTPTSRRPKKKKKKQPYKPLSPMNTNPGGLFDIVQRLTAKEIASSRFGMKIDVVNANTGEVYVRNVSMRMLWHFCGISALDRFAPGDNDRVDILEIPAEEAEKGGIARVIRYMRRACTGQIVRPTGELRIPSFVAGLETIRACRVFGLEADAARIEKLMLHTWMESEEWYMTDEHVELIWDGYHGLLRETALGDAIVWFVLNEVQTGTHPLAEEIRWMLDQEEYESLKERVQSEYVGIRKSWRHESRKQYLERCRVEREQKQRKEEERTGVRPRQEESRRLYSEADQTETSYRGRERHRRGSTRSSSLLDEDATMSDVPAPAASQASSLRRHSNNSRAGADTLRPMSLAESESWTEVAPKIAVASLVPSDEQPGPWSRSESHDSRGKVEEIPVSPKPKLSLLRRLEERIDRR